MTYWCEEKIVVHVVGPGEDREIVVEQPYAQVGSHPASQIVLNDPAVGRRALLLLATHQGIYVLNLDLEGARLEERGRWLTGEEPLSVGPYRLTVTAASGQTAKTKTPDLVAAKAPTPIPVQHVYYGQLLKDRRKFRSALSIVGRRPQCSLQLRGEKVSSFHCAFYWHDRRLWCLDLLSSNGTAKDGEPVVCQELQLGDRVDIGEFTLVYYRWSPRGTTPGMSPDQAADDAALPAEHTDEIGIDSPAPAEIKADSIAEAEALLAAQKHELEAERQRLQDSVDEQRQQLATERGQLDAERQRLTAQRDQFAAEREHWDTEREELAAKRDQLGAERRALEQQLHEAAEQQRLQDSRAQDRQQLATEREQLDAERQQLAAERQALEKQLEETAEQRKRRKKDAPAAIEADASAEAAVALAAQKQEIAAERQRLQDSAAQDRQQLATEREQLATDRQRLSAQREQLTTEREQFEAESKKFEAESEKFAAQHHKLVAEREELAAEHQQLVAERQAQEQQLHAAAEQLKRRMKDVDEDTARLAEQRQTFKQSRDEWHRERQTLTRQLTDGTVQLARVEAELAAAREIAESRLASVESPAEAVKLHESVPAPHFQRAKSEVAAEADYVAAMPEGRREHSEPAEAGGNDLAATQIALREDPTPVAIGRRRTQDRDEMTSFVSGRLGDIEGTRRRQILLLWSAILGTLLTLSVLAFGLWSWLF